MIGQRSLINSVMRVMRMMHVMRVMHVMCVMRAQCNLPQIAINVCKGSSFNL